MLVFVFEKKDRWGCYPFQKLVLSTKFTELVLNVVIVVQ